MAMNIDQINALLPSVIEQTGVNAVIIRPLFDETAPLGSIPREWLENIEPRIQRAGFMPHWQWRGDIMMGGYPRMYIPGTRGQRTSVWRFMIDIFYHIPDDEAVQARCVCGWVGCVNPTHIIFAKHRHDPPALPWL